MKLQLKRKNKSIEVLYDEDDQKLIDQYNWYIDNYGYIVGRKTVNNKLNRVKMHRLVLGVTHTSFDVDHINHLKHDNRKSNLRLVSRSQNNMNTSKKKGIKPKSKFKGVFLHTTIGKKNWRAGIRVNNKMLWLGLFYNELDAAKAYNEAATKYFGEFAFLNELKD